MQTSVSFFSLSTCFALVLLGVFLFLQIKIGRKHHFPSLFWVLYCLFAIGSFVSFVFLIIRFAVSFFYSLAGFILAPFLAGAAVGLSRLYFIPYWIAAKKNHRQASAILILNVLAGWTIIAWIIALIWANTEPRPEQVVIAQPATTQSSTADELMKFKSLLDSGAITQEEFEAKKKELLSN